MGRAKGTDHDLREEGTGNLNWCAVRKVATSVVKTGRLIYKRREE